MEVTTRYCVECGMELHKSSREQVFSPGQQVWWRCINPDCPRYDPPYNTVTVKVRSASLTSHELSDWLDSVGREIIKELLEPHFTFEMLDMGDIIYEVEGAE